MSTLSIEKTYADGVTPTSADLDAICDSLEVFLNTTKLGTDNIADSSITASSTIAPATITAGKIQNSAVTTAKILDNAVTAAKFATGAVTTAKITDLNVTTAKIAANSVTSGKIADDAITRAKKQVNSKGANGSGATSTGVVNYSSGTSLSLSRPALNILGGASGGGASIIISSISTGTVMEASLIMQRAGTTVTNQELKAGPFEYTAGTNTRLIIPSSSLIYIDTTDGSAATVAYRHAVDLTAGSSITSSGADAILEII